MTEGQQIALLKQFGNACGICGRLLPVKDLHHIEWVSLGGGNELENYMPLHPTCHRLFPHALHGIVTIDTMRQLRTMRMEVSETDEAIVDRIRNRDWITAAGTLIDLGLHPLVLRFGSYGRHLQFAETVDRYLSGRRASARVLRGQLRIFSADMALYLDREKEYMAPAIRAAKKSVAVFGNA